MAEFIENLGHTVGTKTVTIEQLSKCGSPIILGTPKLTRNEIYDLMNCLKHEIRHRDKMLNKK